MIINEDGKIVVAVGEPIGYAGKVFRCVQDAETSSDVCRKYCSFNNPQLRSICKMMACGTVERPDEIGVHFVPFGAEEGGEDE